MHCKCKGIKMPGMNSSKCVIHFFLFFIFEKQVVFVFDILARANDAKYLQLHSRFACLP